MSRLDQLALPDETAVGSVLLTLLVFLSVAIDPACNPLRFLLGQADTQDAALTFGAINASIFLIALHVTGALQRRILHRRARLEPADRAPRLLEVGRRIAHEVCGRDVVFKLGGNGLDLNAFCVPGRPPTVALGKGLALGLLKSPERVEATIAHECGHVRAGDLTLILFTERTVLIFGATCVLATLAAQARFWTEAAALHGQWMQGGHSTAAFLLANLRATIPNGTPILATFVVLVVALRHFLRLREFRADARAARAGYAQGLAMALANTSASNMPQPGLFSRLLRFHPTRQERLERLIHETQWARVDMLFVASLAFLIARLDIIEAAVFPDSDPSVFAGLEDLLWGLGHNARFWLESALLMVLTGLLFLQAYRADLTLMNLGAGLSARLGVTGRMMIAVAVGIMLAHLSTTASLTTLVNEPLETWADTFIGLGASGASILATTVGEACIGLAVLTPIIARWRIRPPLLRALLGFLAAAAVGLVVQAVAVNVWIATAFTEDELDRIFDGPIDLSALMRAHQDGHHTLWFLLAVLAVSGMLTLLGTVRSGLPAGPHSQATRLAPELLVDRGDRRD